MKQVIHCYSLSCNKRQSVTRVVGHVKKARGITLAGWRGRGAAAWPSINFLPLSHFPGDSDTVCGYWTGSFRQSRKEAFSQCLLLDFSSLQRLSITHDLQRNKSSGGRQLSHSHAWMTPRASKSTRKQIIFARIRLQVTDWTRLKCLKNLIIRY